MFFCRECGEPLAYNCSKFCGNCGCNLSLAGDPSERRTIAKEPQESSSADLLPYGGVELGADGYPAKNSDWAWPTLYFYRDIRKIIGPSSEIVGGNVERRWIVNTHELTIRFPDLPDIGFCEMVGDGYAIPSVREWPKKYLKKGFPINELPGTERRCTRRAVRRWCHVMITFDPALGRIVPTEIRKYVDTCPGHDDTFKTPNPPYLGRGPQLEVGYWCCVMFDQY